MVYQFLYDEYVIEERDSGAFKVGFDLLGYLRNNEFKSDIIPGYTLFGYQLRPYLSYYPSSHIRIDMGGFFVRDFGEDGFSEIRPILTFKYSKRSYSFIFGTLEGALSHRIIEPIYDVENVIARRNSMPDLASREVYIKTNGLTFKSRFS